MAGCLLEPTRKLYSAFASARRLLGSSAPRLLRSPPPFLAPREATREGKREGKRERNREGSREGKREENKEARLIGRLSS